MSTPSTPRALIIGGSLGGLFTATTLRAIGWDVTVFERSPHELDSRGGGIVLQPDVLDALRFAGVGTSGPLGVRSRDRIYLDRDDAVISRRYMPQTQTSWNMLYGVMRRTLPDGVVQAGEQLLRFEADESGVVAHFASGRVERGDLLIGADGAGSTVRRQLMPGLEPNYSGYVAWRGLVDEPELPASAAALLDDSFVFQQGEGHLLLEYRVPGADLSTAEGRRRWNWVWYRPVGAGAPLADLLTDAQGRRHAFSLPPGALRAGLAAELRDAAAHLLAPSLQALVAATREPFVQAILDLQVPRMAVGRVVLVGDAAFVPRPHTAGSSAKAAANALALARALQAHPGDLATALAGWQQGQLREGFAMTEWGMDIGDRIMGLERSREMLQPV
ncbi:MAG: hypothetical protein DI603_13540 [Roseateles depolymerans]|uniref:Uncharacterized protein n=1 Tax=Roseateles depolymerans TaxID=76731 RepID=A0A2W5DGH7_9BURK|nr:MAG: hypothetical protein DI603_13540 [Roseateles depolymerans]